MKKSSSLISSLQKNSIAAIIVTATLIAFAIISLEYKQFTETSENLATEYTAAQKKLIRNEVIRISRYIDNKRSQIKSILEQRIQQRVSDAHTIATNIYLQHKGKWPEDKIKKSITAALRGLRFFNGDGYYFVHTLQGVLQLHGLKPEAEGKNRLNIKDSNGHFIVKDIIRLIKMKNEGFLSYSYTSFTHPDTETNKIVFVKRFEPYDWVIGTGDYEENIDKQIQKEIIQYIDQLRFGKDSYIFVVDYKGTVITNPAQKHLIGKNIWNLEDPNGVKVIQEERRAVENPDGDFIYYVWNKPSTSAPSPKISFMKGIEDWKWMVGAGLYLDDIDATIIELNHSLKQSLLIKLITLLFLSGLAVVIIILKTQHTSKKINKEQEQFIEFFKNVSTKSEKINLENLHFTEFKRLAESANRMLDKHLQIESDKNEIQIQLRQSQKMEALGKIVGGIAHDFNNLLGIMMGYSELLTKGISKENKYHSYACHILEAAKRGSRLTKKLLGISHSKDQSASILDLNKLLTDNSELFQRTITAKIKLEYRLEQNLRTIFVDSSDLNDALLNLCINAMHAMENTSHPKLILTTANVSLSAEQAKLHSLSMGNFVELSISDNGTGIDSLVIEHIFEPFFTTKGNYGTGLGLSQVYAFMKRCEGTIKIDSTVGSGTNVRLIFPQAKNSHEIESAIEFEAGQTDNLKGNETILIVDDEPAITALGAEILQPYGYTVIQAGSGANALNVLAKQPVDLLISDIIMPEMSGGQLVARVRELYPNVAIQLCSGYSEKDSIKDIEPALYNETLVKPFDSISLLKRIRTLLNHQADQCPST